MIWILKNFFAIFLFCVCVTCGIFCIFTYFSSSSFIIDGESYIIQFDSFIAAVIAFLLSLSLLLVYTWGRVVSIPSMIISAIKLWFVKIKSPKKS